MAPKKKDVVIPSSLPVPAAGSKNCDSNCPGYGLSAQSAHLGGCLADYDDYGEPDVEGVNDTEDEEEEEPLAKTQKQPTKVVTVVSSPEKTIKKPSRKRANASVVSDQERAELEELRRLKAEAEIEKRVQEALKLYNIIPGIASAIANYEVPVVAPQPGYPAQTVKERFVPQYDSTVNCFCGHPAYISPPGTSAKGPHNGFLKCPERRRDKITNVYVGGCGFFVFKDLLPFYRLHPRCGCNAPYFLDKNKMTAYCKYRKCQALPLTV